MRESTIFGKVSFLAAAVYFCAMAGSGPVSAADQPATSAAAVLANPLRNAYFGDLHLHTSLFVRCLCLDGHAGGP